MTHGMAYPFVDRRYAWLGGSPQEAVQGLASKPVAAIQHILQPPKLKFLFQLFAPLLFLPLLGWPIILLAFPVLGYLMLSDYPPQWSVGSYYNPPLLAFLFFCDDRGNLQDLRAGLRKRRRSAGPVVAGAPRPGAGCRGGRLRHLDPWPR